MKTRFLTFITLLAILMTLSASRIALANEEVADPVFFPMILDCDALSESALEYARSQDLCLHNHAQGNIAPEDVKYGDCGWSSLFIHNLGGGNARFDMAAYSSKGAIVSVNYNVNWHNWNSGANGDVPGTDYPFSSSWSKSEQTYTGPGSVTAVMTGTVTLWWGGVCRFLNPTDYKQITN